MVLSAIVDIHIPYCICHICHDSHHDDDDYDWSHMLEKARYIWSCWWWCGKDMDDDDDDDDDDDEDDDDSK